MVCEAFPPLLGRLGGARDEHGLRTAADVAIEHMPAPDSRALALVATQLAAMLERMHLEV